MQGNRILSASQAADVLHIHENTLSALAASGQIPHLRTKSDIDGDFLYTFNTQEITKWLQFNPVIKTDDQAYVERLKRQVQKKYPKVLQKLQRFNKQFVSPRKKKGYSLSMVSNKKLGFVFYVRYIEKGKLVPTRRSTHTNNKVAAIKWAIDNRSKVLTEYHNRKANGGTIGTLYAVMRKYYAENSPYLLTDVLRGRTINEDWRKHSHNFILNTWIPFLKKKRIKTFDAIDTALMAHFQDHLLLRGNKRKTVNKYVSIVNTIFDHMLIHGQIKSNPCVSLSSLKVGNEEHKTTGCYEVSSPRGVFNKRWKDDRSYLLCLMIYTTNMRNSEIEKIQQQDFFIRGNIRFLNIPESKSVNGERIVPIHDFVYKQIMAYVQRNGQNEDGYIFKLPKSKKFNSTIYRAAYLEMAKHIGYTLEQVKEENIKFYSGRHFWKTLMNAKKLGDVEEYFMGHKISGDMAKLYNHKDKQGQEIILAKAKEVLAILDEALFAK